MNKQGVILNPRRRKFCLLFVETGNATQSAIKAGYAEKSASHYGCMLLKNQIISKEIDRISRKQEEIQGEIKERTIETAMVTKEWIIEKQKAVFRTAHEGGQTNAANKALENLHKFCGYDVEKNPAATIDAITELLQAVDGRTRGLPKDVIDLIPEEVDDG